MNSVSVNVLVGDGDGEGDVVGEGKTERGFDREEGEEAEAESG